MTDHKHDWVRETFQDYENMRDVVAFWCKDPTCWRSKEFNEENPEVVDFFKTHCVSDTHRLDDSTMDCVDCGMGYDQIRLGENTAGYRRVNEGLDEALLFTLPRTISDEDRAFFTKFYKKFLKERVGIEIPEGGLVPWLKNWKP